MGLLATIASWTSLVGAFLTLILGLVHIFSLGASIHWPSGGFIDDEQAADWRAPMFSFVPDTLCEVWTPFIFGLVGTMAHMKDFTRLRLVTDSFVNLFMFNLVEGLFATIAYNGGLGIIFSCVVFLAALLCLISIFVDPEHASVDLTIPGMGKA